MPRVVTICCSQCTGQLLIFKNNSTAKQDSQTENLHCMPKKIAHIPGQKSIVAHPSIHRLIVFCYPLKKQQLGKPNNVATQKGYQITLAPMPR